MIPRTRGRRWTAFCVAAGGVLLGHQLTYRFAAPHGTQALLRETGHGYLPTANDLGVVVAMVALAAIFLGRLTDPGETRSPLVGLAKRVALFQVTAFLAMEIAERVASGSPLTGLLDHGLVPIGIIVQVVVAVVVALAIRWLIAAADLTRSVLASAPAPELPPQALALASTGRTRARRSFIGAAGVRGPPSPGP